LPLQRRTAPTIAPVELSPEEFEIIGGVARLNWANINPVIFGALLQRSMDRGERHALGAHFTSEADIQRIVDPTIIKPWTDRIPDFVERDGLASQGYSLPFKRVRDLVLPESRFVSMTREKPALASSPIPGSMAPTRLSGAMCPQQLRDVFPPEQSCERKRGGALFARDIGIGSVVEQHLDASKTASEREVVNEAKAAFIRRDSMDGLLTISAASDGAISSLSGCSPELAASALAVSVLLLTPKRRDGVAAGTSWGSSGSPKEKPQPLSWAARSLFFISACSTWMEKPP